MLSLIIVTVSALTADTSVAMGPGANLVLKGSFEAKQTLENGPRKEFQLALMVEEADDQARSICWTLEERGGGGWSWPDHFGRARVTSQTAVQGSVPSLNFERDDGDYQVALPLPIARFDGPLAVGKKWMEGRNQHEVVEEATWKGRAVWNIEVRSPIGINRTYSVDKESPLIWQLDETVFVGQGEEHRLHYETEIHDALDDGRRAQLLAGVQQLERLRDQLHVEAKVARKIWTEEQLVALRNSIPEVRKLGEEEFLRSLALEVERDAKQQKDRAGAVSVLRDKFLGNPIPEFELTDLEGNTVKSAALVGQVTVLHFWEYRDAPLKEPYGQTAYLDFLARNARKGTVKVYGVAVDPGLADGNIRGKAAQSVRKFNAFMNISYPVLLDSGTIIRRLGDPRTAGAKLPLYVVLDRTGKVIHYHVGFYDIVPNRGLEELEKIIEKAQSDG